MGLLLYRLSSIKMIDNVRPELEDNIRTQGLLVPNNWFETIICRCAQMMNLMLEQLSRILLETEHFIRMILKLYKGMD